MPQLKTALSKIRTLEELAENSTVIHRIHPIGKMITTLVYLITVISFDKYDLSGLAIFVLYPVLMMALSETPYKPLLMRLLVALPFSFFAALSNVFFERAAAFVIAGFPVSFGLISFTSIIFKTILTVMAVLILVSTTPITKVAHELVYLKVPKIFVIQMMLTYRYIGVLIEETGNMITAYHMRSPRQKGIAMAHMGTFAGQLLLRSFDRAERIYFAMKCRGFDGEYNFAASRPMGLGDWLYMAGLTGAFLVLRYINISMLFGELISGRI
jgi:cobalt/nickel transport system permease protein